MNPVLLLLCIVYSYLGLIWEVIIAVTALIIHETAHVISALMLGVRVLEIEIFPFGGQAKVEDFTGLNPEKEIYIALTGPVTSLSVASFFYFLYPSLNENFHMFINVNFLLGFFNLLPALPLDGGRILRAVLSRFIGYKEATRRAAFMGKFIACSIFGYGIYLAYADFVGANFVLIGIFLFWAATREEKFLNYSFMRFLVNKEKELSQNGFLICRQVVSRPDTPIKKILNSAKPTYYMMVVVVDENHKVIGMYSEAELIECLLEKGPRAMIKDC